MPTSVLSSDPGDDKIAQPFDFTLSRPLKYSKGAEAGLETKIITLLEPTGRNRNECEKLEQMICRAFNEQTQNRKMPTAEEIDAAKEARAASKKADQGDGASETGLTGSDVIRMVAMSTVSDLGEFINETRKLISGTGLAMVNGDVKLTNTLADEMSYTDLKKLCGAYIAGFILPSALGL